MNKINQFINKSYREKREVLMSTLRKGLIVLIFIGDLIAFQSLQSAENKQELKDFSYYQDFEQNDPVKSWADYSKQLKVNYKGLSDENAYSGKKSFKLDVTFYEAGRYLWYIPVSAPSDKLYTFSGYMYLSPETNAQATLGVTFKFPPLPGGGFTLPSKKMYTAYKTTKDQWKLEKINNLGFHASQKASNVLDELFWGIEKEAVCRELESIIIDLRAQKNQRIVLYIDDIKIIGKQPELFNYYEKVIKNWPLVLNKLQKETDKWNESIITLEEKYKEFNPLSTWGIEIKKQAEFQLNNLKQKISKLSCKDHIFNKKEFQEININLQQLKYFCHNLNKLAENPLPDYLCYIISNPTQNIKILPFDKVIPGNVDNKIEITACRGEYEASSFVIQALKNIDSLNCEVSNLLKEKDKTSPDKLQEIIDKSNIDIKVVKCWYQAGTAWYANEQNKSKRILIPELLINDDTLVKVDYSTEHNYLKLKFPNGEKYECISQLSSNTDTLSFSYPNVLKMNLSVHDFPVIDAQHLQPVNILSETNKQFWLTVKIPNDSSPGVYTGKLSLKSNGSLLEEIAIKVSVLPFDLRSPYYTSSIDYHGILNPNGSTSLSYYKTEEQFKADLKNMLVHGVTNCQHYFPVTKESLTKVLKLRQEIGMDNDVIYLKGYTTTGNSEDKTELEKLKKWVKEVIDITKPFGTKEVYFYGLDEAEGEELVSQRKAWNTIHEAGGKVFVAGDKDNIELMGDIQDLQIRSGWLSHEEATQWHEHGHKIFSYMNPQIGIENPDIYRRNFGLLLWKNDYDGAANNAYQQAYANIWNDFTHPAYRASSIVYPTINGGINTIAWEGYREGVDDVRYITTLEKMIEKIKKTENKNDTVMNILAYAEKFITDLKNSSDIENKNLNDIRGEIIKHILALKNTEHDK